MNCYRFDNVQMVFIIAVPDYYCFRRPSRR